MARDRRRGEKRDEENRRCCRIVFPFFSSLSSAILSLPPISCKALLSRCGNFIFATNLQPLLLPRLSLLFPPLVKPPLSLSRVELSVHFHLHDLRPIGRHCVARGLMHPERSFHDVATRRHPPSRQAARSAFTDAIQHINAARCFRIASRFFISSISSLRGPRHFVGSSHP